MLCRDMTDIASGHLFPGQRLLPVLRPVIVIVMHHGAHAVVPELCRRHRRSLQVAPLVSDALSGTPGFLREVHLPAATVLRLQIALPLIFVTDMHQPRQAAGIYQVITVAQEPNDGPAPDFLHGVLLKNDIAPDAVFNIEAAAGDGQVNVRVRNELATAGVEGTEDADPYTLFTVPPEHGAGGCAGQALSRGLVVVEKRPQQVGHG